VVTLGGQSGDTPALITPQGDLIGGEGIIVPASLAAGSDRLRPNHHDTYRFTIGLTRKEPITFTVNVVGDATGGPCR
jgi:hypothetical protein